jgi:hypothetical protein
MKQFVYIATMLLCISASALGGSLSIRLVNASNAGEGIDGSLNDVAKALKGQLPFKRYQLVSSATASLPAGKAVSSLSGYKVTCNGPQNALAIRVDKGKRNLVSTTVNLQSKRPVLLGGFPGKAGGKLILVFVAR